MMMEHQHPANSSSSTSSSSNQNIVNWKSIDNHSLGLNLDVFESNFHCPICQDYYDNPHTLKCGHSFCAICIRRHLDSTINRFTSNICPHCREKAEAFDLRKNVVLQNLTIQFRELRQDLFISLQEAATKISANQNKIAASLSKYHLIKGKAITGKVTPPYLHGANMNKVRKAVEDVTTGSSIRLRLDGDKDAIEKRLKELIHLINAQLGSEHPLTLDGAIQKINDETISRAQSSFQIKGFDSIDKDEWNRSFDILIQKAKEQKRLRKEQDAKQSQKEEGKSEEKSSFISSSITDHNQQMEFTQAPSQVTPSSSTKGEILLPESPKEESQRNQSQGNSRWKVVISSQYNRPFYYDSLNGVGQFVIPDELKTIEEVTPPSSINRENLSSQFHNNQLDQHDNSQGDKMEQEQEEQQEFGESENLSPFALTQYPEATQDHFPMTVPSQPTHQHHPRLDQSSDDKEVELIVIDDTTTCQSIPNHSTTTKSNKFPTQLQTQIDSPLPTQQSASDGWTCEACTFFNLRNKDNCEICETVNPANRLRRSQRKAMVMSPSHGLSSSSSSVPLVTPFSQSKRKKTTR